MRNLRLFGALVFILTLVSAMPLSAQCYQGSCPVGPCICGEQLADFNLSDPSCDFWKLGNGAVDARAQGHVDLGTVGAYVEQEVDAYGEIEVRADITMLPSYPGVERLAVEIRSLSGALLETLGIIYPNSPSGTYKYFTNEYDGERVKLRFRRQGVVNAGSTTFRIKSAHFWTCGG